MDKRAVDAHIFQNNNKEEFILNYEIQYGFHEFNVAITSPYNES